MANNPNEMRSLDDFILQENTENGEPLASALQSEGWIISDGKINGRRASSAILDQKPKGKYVQSSESKNWNNANFTDRITLHLAYALQQYRDDGRPDGEQTSTIQGMGGPLVTVSTSLAAAIVEYHDNMMNYAYEKE